MRIRELISSFINAQRKELEFAGQMCVSETPALNGHFDRQSAGIFHDVLMYLIPNEQLQMTAYDDYYPAVFYAIEKLPNSAAFIHGMQKLREELFKCFNPDDLVRFEKIVVDNIQEFSVLRQLMQMPANAYPQHCVSGIHSKPEDPLYYDLATNTRGLKFIHTVGVEALMEKIEIFEKRAGLGKNSTHQPALLQTPVLPAPKA